MSVILDDRKVLIGIRVFHNFWLEICMFQKFWSEIWGLINLRFVPSSSSERKAWMLLPPFSLWTFLTIVFLVVFQEFWLEICVFRKFWSDIWGACPALRQTEKLVYTCSTFVTMDLLIIVSPCMV